MLDSATIGWGLCQRHADWPIDRLAGELADLYAAKAGTLLAVLDQRCGLLAQVTELGTLAGALVDALPACAACLSADGCPEHPWAAPLRALHGLLAQGPLPLTELGKLGYRLAQAEAATKANG